MFASRPDSEGYGRDSVQAENELQQAERMLADISAWDARHNTPAYAVISRPMRRAMAWHINEIRRLAQR